MMVPTFGVVCIVIVVFALVYGLWVNALVRDPYEQIGGGKMALDVPDNVPSPPLDSPAGRAELHQLQEAIAAVRAAREAEGESKQEAA